MVPLSFRQITERLNQMQLPETDVVIGIGSGGIPPATMVAYHLNAELQVMVLNYRDEQNNPRYDEPQVLEKPPDREMQSRKPYGVERVHFLVCCFPIGQRRNRDAVAAPLQRKREIARIERCPGTDWREHRRYKEQIH